MTLYQRRGLVRKSDHVKYECNFVNILEDICLNLVNILEDMAFVKKLVDLPLSLQGQIIQLEPKRIMHTQTECSVINIRCSCCTRLTFLL